MPRHPPPVIHVSRSYEEMERYSRQQDARLTPDERLAILAELRRQVYGDNPPDVRESERNR